MKNVCTQKTLCRDDSCDLCYRRSFASNRRVSDWNYVLNNGVLPRHVFLNSNNKYWFTCSNCEHDFDNRLSHITSDDCWCPYCSVPPKKLCKNVDCLICLKKSFASHEKSQFWNNALNKQVTPRHVFLNSKKVFWFSCPSCSHAFKKRLSHMHGNGGCPYCRNQKLCNNETCMQCLNKSFSISVKVKFWNYAKRSILKLKQ